MKDLLVWRVHSAHCLVFTRRGRRVRKGHKKKVSSTKNRRHTRQSRRKRKLEEFVANGPDIAFSWFQMYIISKSHISAKSVNISSVGRDKDMIDKGGQSLSVW
jgi:hypothetical protein